MTHGDERGIYGIDANVDLDEYIIKHDEIIEMFSANNCPQLAGKPKIIIFQACRGRKCISHLRVLMLIKLLIV